MNQNALMIMVAPNGARLLKKDNLGVPITPAEIADDVLACAEAGAAMAHLHARDINGGPSDDIEIFREIVDLICAKSDIVLQLSLGTIGFTVDQALAPLQLAPAMVSFPMRAFDTENGETPADIREMAERIKASGIIPELDVAGEATMAGACRLIEEGLTNKPLAFGINVKEPATLQEGADRIFKFLSMMPEGANWWLTKGGRYGLAMRALAIELGGHVRLGFEDSIYDYHTGYLAESNASQVEKVVKLAFALGRSVAKPADVREWLAGR